MKYIHYGLKIIALLIGFAACFTIATSMIFLFSSGSEILWVGLLIIITLGIYELLVSCIVIWRISVSSIKHLSAVVAINVLFYASILFGSTIKTQWQMGEKLEHSILHISIIIFSICLYIIMSKGLIYLCKLKK